MNTNYYVPFIRKTNKKHKHTKIKIKENQFKIRKIDFF